VHYYRVSFLKIVTVRSFLLTSNECLRYRAGPKIPKGHARVFWGLDETDYTGVAVVGLGKQGLGINKLEEIHEGKESVRAAAAGILSIQIMYYANTIISFVVQV